MRKILLLSLLIFMVLPAFPQEKILSEAELAAYPTYTRIQKTPVDSVFKMCLENIHEIPADFDKWNRLQQLCIFGNDWDYDLFQLPGYFYNFPNLTYLCIANTDIASLSTSIKNFTNLETLNVANNQLVSLPKTITTLSNLKELTIDNNIDKIPEIASLEALNIYFETNLGDDSGTIPQGIGSLAKVKHLYLNSENTFINIPQMISTIKMMPSLETLSFMDPNLEEMDIRDLTGIKKIKELNLPSVLADPGVFAGFSHLQRFSFGKYLETNPKKREEFWNTLAGFKNLQEVSATFNIADTQYYKQFKNINIVLNLDGKLDDQIAALRNTPGLKCLTFPRSSVIPRVLSEMKTLREVDVTELYGVDISFIFGYLMTIPTLEKITISNDQLTKFPQETVKLMNLKEMVVYNIQHGVFNAITQKEKERAQKLLPNCKFTYIETF